MENNYYIINNFVIVTDYTKMKRALLIIFLLLSVSAFAQKKEQQAYLDSLVAGLPKMKEDTVQISVLHTLAWTYHRTDPEKGVIYARKMIDIAQKIGDKDDEAEAWNDLGYNYDAKGDKPAALEAYFKSLILFEDQSDKEGIGKTSANIGEIYTGKKDFSTALLYTSRALKIFEDAKDKRRMCYTLLNMGGIYFQLNEKDKSLDYFTEALKIAEEIKQKNPMAMILSDMAGLYNSKKQYPIALATLFRALRIIEDQVNDKQKVAILGCIGRTYLSISRDSIAWQPDSLISAGRAANLTKAIEYLSKGITLGKSSESIDDMLGILPNLSIADSLQGNYKGALDAYKEYTSLKDSIYNTTNSEKISNLETKRAIELKDKDIQIAKLAVAKKRNERVFYIAGIVLLVIIIIVIYRNLRTQKTSNLLLGREKKRSDDLLLNILPAEVAEELKDSGTSAAKQFDEVSVLFTDFVNFTGTAENLSPQALVKELHECFTSFDAIAGRNGLEKIKTIGDAYMAVCGLPLADPRHAQNTVQAAIEIRDFIAERKQQGKNVFEIRIGINSGPVVAGIVGVKKFAYDIWGDTVNTAARMEQNSEAGRINISGTTYALVKNEYSVIPRGKVSAKNKGEIDMYFVEATVAGA